MIDLLFSLVNFGIVTALIGYFMWRYGLPMLTAKVETEKRELQALREHHKQLVDEFQVLDESIVAQEATCASLMEKISEWKTRVDEKEHEQRAAAQALQELLKRKIEKQSEYHAIKMRYQQLTPLIIKELEESAQSHFKDEMTSYKYLQHVLANLKK